MNTSKITTGLWEYLAKEQRPIALYGTGDGADKIISVLERYGIKDLIAAVFASDGFVRDRYFHGFKVISYDECCRKLEGKDFIVLVCFGSSRPEVLSFVERIAAERELYVPDVPVYGDILFDRSFYDENLPLIEEVSTYLSDDRSSSCYENYIRYKLTGDLRYLAACESDPGEESSLLTNLSSGCFIDLGAYYGDTVKHYLEMSDSFTSCVAVEPEKHSFKRLEAYANTLSGNGFEIRCINALIGSKCGTAEVSGSRGRGTRAAVNSNVALNNIRMADVITVDSLGLDNVSFIKFDVEGSELEAIEGARETILKCRPAMKIACYHRSEDVFTLVRKVHDIRSDYKIFMRHTRCIPGWDTDFYFV